MGKAYKETGEALLPPFYALLAPEGRCAGCFAASATDGINIVAVRKLVQTALLGLTAATGTRTRPYGNGKADEAF